MITKCTDCGVAYDDAKCYTVCPHHQFLTDSQLKQKDLAISLLGERVYFFSDLRTYTVAAVTAEGMVLLDGLKEPFNPQLFKVVP